MRVQEIKKFGDVMPVVVALGAGGLFLIRPKEGKTEVLTGFPEDFERVVEALAKTYARPMPKTWSPGNCASSSTTSTTGRPT